MANYKVSPDKSCPDCHGTGEVRQVVATDGMWQAVEWVLCECYLRQLPDDFDCMFDEVEIVYPQELENYFSADYEEDEEYLMACFDWD